MTKTFQYHSSIIHYQTFGKGKPVLLLHGFGEDSSVWQNQIEFLQKNYYLIVPDLPGSSNSAIINDMSIEGMADCVKEIISVELHQVSPAEGHLEGAFGHSMGGYITLALVEKHSTLIKKFGLIHSSAFADNEEKIIARKKSIEFIQQNGAYEFLKATIPNLFATGQGASMCQDAFEASDTYMNTLIEQGKNFAPQALIAYYTVMINRPARIELLKNCEQPVLFIIGEHDQAIPFNQSLQQCHLPKQSHIHILRNSAHMGMWEEREKVNETLMTFLQTT